MESKSQIDFSIQFLDSNFSFLNYIFKRFLIFIFNFEFENVFKLGFKQGFNTLFLFYLFLYPF